MEIPFDPALRRVLDGLGDRVLTDERVFQALLRHPGLVSNTLRRFRLTDQRLMEAIAAGPDPCDVDLDIGRPCRHLRRAIAHAGVRARDRNAREITADDLMIALLATIDGPLCDDFALMRFDARGLRRDLEAWESTTPITQPLGPDFADEAADWILAKRTLLRALIGLRAAVRRFVIAWQGRGELGLADRRGYLEGIGRYVERAESFETATNAGLVPVGKLRRWLADWATGILEAPGFAEAWMRRHGDGMLELAKDPHELPPIWRAWKCPCCDLGGIR